MLVTGSEWRRCPPCVTAPASLCIGGAAVHSLQPAVGSVALHADRFVPKQLGRASDLAPLCLSPPAMVHRCAGLSAAVRRRCHAVRHSYPRLGTAGHLAPQPQLRVVRTYDTCENGSYGTVETGLSA